MAVRKQLQRDHAELLIIKEGLNQKEAAERVGVTEKTMSRWVKEGKWDNQRRSFAATRNSIIANLQQQLELLQTSITKNDGGLATSKEADMLVKLANAIKKLESDAGVGETIEVAMKFVRFVSQSDTVLAQNITRHFDAYIQSLL